MLFRLDFVFLHAFKNHIMFNKNIKLVLVGLLIGFGIYQIIDRSIGNGIFLIFLSLLPLFFYFRNECLLMAFIKLRSQNFEGAQSWLNRIKSPESALLKKQQGYYNYLSGLLSAQTNMNVAEKHFKKAIELGLSMDLDMAVAKLNLAGIALSRRRKLEATQLLADVKKLDKQNMLKEQVNMMKQQMKKI